MLVKVKSNVGEVGAVHEQYMILKSIGDGLQKSTESIMTLTVVCIWLAYLFSTSLLHKVDQSLWCGVVWCVCVCVCVCVRVVEGGGTHIKLRTDREHVYMQTN